MQGLSDSVYRDCLNSIPLTNTLTTGVVVVNDRYIQGNYVNCFPKKPNFTFCGLTMQTSSYLHTLISRSQWPTFGIWYLLTVQLISKIILLGTCSSTVDWCILHVQLHLYSKVGHIVNFSRFIIYLYYPNCYLWYVES